MSDYISRNFDPNPYTPIKVEVRIHPSSPPGFPSWRAECSCGWVSTSSPPEDLKIVEGEARWHRRRGPHHSPPWTGDPSNPQTKASR